MRSEIEIEREIDQLGRPSMANCDIGNIKKLSYVRKLQLDWDDRNPVLKKKFFELLTEAQASKDADDATKAEWQHKDSVEREIARSCGERIRKVAMNPQDTPAMKALGNWEPSEYWSMTLLGGVGCGKTVAAAARFTVAVHQNLRPLWLNCGEAATRSIYGEQAAEDASVAVSTKLLVLDDLGSELASEPWKAWLENVLVKRHARLAATIVTTNLDAETLKARIGQRATDRLREGKIVGLSGPSMRRRPA